MLAILCGGSDTRLWSLSRVGFPKHLVLSSTADSPLSTVVQRINGPLCHDIHVDVTIVVVTIEL